MTASKPSPLLAYPALLTDIKQRIQSAQTRAMLAFYREYRDLSFVPQPVTQIETSP